MKLIYPTLLLCSNVYGHGGDDGPSSLENEFAKLSHLHLPMNYSTIHGLSFNYSLPTEHGEEEHSEDGHGEESGIDIDVHPVLFGGFDEFRRVVSQEVSATNSLKIEASNPEAPYLLIENRKWDLGLGGEGDFHLPLPIFSVGLGVSYLKGKNYYTIRALTRRDEHRRPLTLPTSAENLRGWRVGDELAYASKGSVIFNVFIGIEPFFHLGPEYIHTGTYKVRALLESEDTLEIEVTTTESKSFGFEGNAVVANAEFTKGAGHLDSLIYEFDLTDPKAYPAINYLFRGRIDLTNREMLHSGGAISVKTEMRNSTLSVSGSFGLPVVYLRGGGAGSYQNEGTIETSEEGQSHSSQVYSSTLSRESFTRGVLSNHRWENETYVSTLVRDEASADHSILSSVFSWSFSKDRMSAVQLREKLEKIGRIFELPELRDLKLPATKLGYVKADIGVSLNGREVLDLLNLTNLKLYHAQAVKLLTDDFKSFGHRAFCRVQSHDPCLKRYETLLQSRFQQLRSLVLGIDEAYLQRKINHVPKKLALAVKSLFKSKYLLRSFLQHQKDVKVELRLEGERLKKHALVLNE